MTYKLFLDDLRNPKSNDWVVVRSYDEFVECIKINGCPSHISFDHDLGEGKTGYDAAKFLVELDLDTKCIPNNFNFNVHSANPIGAKNIEMLLDNYIRCK